MELKKRTEVISVFRYFGPRSFGTTATRRRAAARVQWGQTTNARSFWGIVALRTDPVLREGWGPGTESYPLICANCRQFSLLLRVDWRHSRTTKTWPQPDWTKYGPRPQPETSNLPVSCKSNAKPMHSRLESCEWCRGPNPKSFGSNRMPGNCVGPHIRNEYCVGTTQHGRRRG